MKISELNKQQRALINGSFHNEVEFHWEDDELLDVLLGNLPKIRLNCKEQESRKFVYEIESLYNSYNFFNTNKEEFLKKIKENINRVRNIEPYWTGLYAGFIDEYIELHKSCVIFGEGGIGKSYFIKCLETELESKAIKHLVIYGKYLKTLSDIDFNEIKEIAQKEEFVFIFDAINEIEISIQQELISSLQKIKDIKGLRIIITYRTFSIVDKIQKDIHSLGKEYKFSGVSFESVVEWLRKEPIEDISEYIDVLYMNNPFLLSRLPFVFKSNRGKNNIVRYTHIYEDYIKNSIDINAWRATKKLSKFLYEKEKKTFCIDEIIGIIDNPMKFLSNMEQKGFLRKFYYSDCYNYVFNIESLADFLIVRSMFETVSNQSTEEIIKVINAKLRKFYNLNRECIVIMLFDKFSQDFSKIKEILIKTKLIKDVSFEVLVKIHIDENNIKLFLETFIPREKEKLLLYFGGYLNRGFNCTNYLNKYYLERVDRQTEELSRQLSGKYDYVGLQGRLKNMLYLTVKCNCTHERLYENFYTAIWCSASCKSNIQNLSKKLLFEVVQKDKYFIKECIDIYDSINDYYIKDAIIHVLCSCENNAEISTFLSKLLLQKTFIFAKSLKRICVYLGKEYDYIHYSKTNVVSCEKEEVSQEFIDLMHRIDLFDKDMLPFKVFGTGDIECRKEFLDVPKRDINKFNEWVINNFQCVNGGECSGSFAFIDDLENLYRVKYRKNILESKRILIGFEKLVKKIFKKYDIPFKYEEYLKKEENDYLTSVMRKCVKISADLLLGSLMCNYYQNEFESFNGYSGSIGYQPYNPLEYDEEISLCSPLSVYNATIEKMGNEVVKNIESPEEKDEKWWNDLEITKVNIENLLRPVNVGGSEWVLIAGRIALKDSKEKESWKEVYIIRVADSKVATILGDDNDRHLTIELEDYKGNINEYINCQENKEFCREISTISYNSDIFEDTRLVFPPIKLIEKLSLNLNIEDMSWINTRGEKIIVCNNNKSDYYQDYISGSMFMRKQEYDKLKEDKAFKFFAFSEKLIKGRGFSPETDYHFELFNNKIIKMYPNTPKKQKPYKRKVNQLCKNCKYGFYKKETLSKLRKFIKKYSLDDSMFD